MPVVFVATSKSLSAWGADVGLTKHLYFLGVADESAEAALSAMNAESFAGQGDWKLLKKEKVEAAGADAIDADALIDRLAGREKMVDPGLYPKIRGVRGIFKVKPENVENHLLVQKALESGQELSAVKVKPADIGAYLIASALR